MLKPNNRIVITTGGTGGHVFPAEALGNELLEQSYDVTFVGGGLKNNRYFHRNSFKYEEVAASSLFKVNFFRSVWRILRGIRESLFFLSSFCLCVVFGFGCFF